MERKNRENIVEFICIKGDSTREVDKIDVYKEKQEVVAEVVMVVAVVVVVVSVW